MSTQYQSVAVVDADSDNAIVWHIDVSSDVAGLSRMSGAWVLGLDEHDKLELLTRSRYLAATTQGENACENARAQGHSGLIDLAQTIKVVEAEINRLQANFEEAAAKSKSALVSPRWPRLPHDFDVSRPPADADAPAQVAIALGIARWLESVALAWESLEQQRTMRKYLRGDDVEQRAFPIVLAY
ncbi:hypothetical protein [Mycobacterium sp. URHB0021]